MLMSLQLNPTLRATTAVTSPNIRQSSAILDAGHGELRQKYGPASRRSPAASRMPLNVGETDYDALLLQLDKRFSKQLQRPRVLHAGVFARQHQRQRRRGERLPGARRHAPGAERGADDVRSAAQLRRQRHGADSAHRRPELQLGGARAERDAVQPDQRQHRSRPQRHDRRAAAGGRLLGHRAPTPTR